MKRTTISDLTGQELLRDQRLFRQLKKRITFTEKLTLMSLAGDYVAYQKALHELARRRGLSVPPAK